MAEFKADVLVLGAGMVGVGAALHLQPRGRDVILVDKHERAGFETNFRVRLEVVERGDDFRDVAGALVFFVISKQARRAIADKVAGPLGVSIEEAALSIVDLTTGEYLIAPGNPCEHPYEALPWNLYS